MRSIFWKGLSAGLLGLVLAAAPAAADKMTVILDWFVNPDHGPIVIAQEKGYFADVGLEVEVVAPADPADPPKMAAAVVGERSLSPSTI